VFGGGCGGGRLDPQSVLTAIIEVAENLMLAEACNVELDELPASLRKPPTVQ
jgi:hypothetical protein